MLSSLLLGVFFFFTLDTKFKALTDDLHPRRRTLWSRGRISTLQDWIVSVVVTPNHHPWSFKITFTALRGREELKHSPVSRQQFCWSSRRFSALLKGISVVVVVVTVGQKRAFHSIPLPPTVNFLISFSLDLSRDCNLWSSGHKLWTFRLQLPSWRSPGAVWIYATSNTNTVVFLGCCFFSTICRRETLYFLRYDG